MLCQVRLGDFIGNNVLHPDYFLNILDENPDIIAHRVVDEVIADTVRATSQDDTGKQTKEQCETNEDNGKVAKQEEEK